MTRKFGAKHSVAQKSVADYNRRRKLVTDGKAMWVRHYSAGVAAACERAGL